MKIYTKEIYDKIWEVIIETDNIKLQEDYRWISYMELIETAVNIFKFSSKKDDADFLIHLIKEFTLSWDEKEKLIEFLKQEYDLK